MNKPKIMIIIPDRLDKPVGGLGVQCKNLIENLKKDFNFEILGYPDDESKDPNYTGALNPFPRVQHSTLTTAVGQIAYFAEAVKKEKPDIVHAYDWSSYLSGVYTSRHFNVPLVVSMQLSVNLLNSLGIKYVADDQNYDGLWLQQLHMRSEIMGLEVSDKIIQVSEAYKKYFDRYPGLNEKTVVIPNGIDLKKWQNYKKTTLPGTGKYKIVYIGRFSKMKNVEAILNAKVPKEVDLIFVGKQEGGDDRIFKSMKDFVQREDNVYYHDPVYGQEKIDFLNSADAVIIPSVHEPFGIVALEGLASGSIVLSSFVDGMSDFLSEDFAINCGITFKTIEGAYQKFLNLSEENKEKMKEEGYGVALKYSWKSAAEKMKRVYDDLL